MRKIAFMFLLVLLTGCVSSISIDYIEEYKDYFKYSLGEYEVLSKEDKTYRGDPLPTITDYIEWSVGYKTDRGAEEEFTFSNRDLLSEQIVTEASSNAEQQMKQDFIPMYYAKEVWANNELDDQLEKDKLNVNTYTALSSAERIKQAPKIVNDQIGIKLTSITPQELVEKWNVRFWFVFSTEDADEQSCIEKRTYFENMIRKAAQYLGQEAVGYEFSCDFDDISFEGKYNSKTNQFTGRTRYQIMNYTEEGLLKTYRNAIYTNLTGDTIEISDVKFAYLRERGYYVTANTIRQILSVIGTTVVESPVSIVWDFGNNHYTFYTDSEDGLQYFITKNDEVIHEVRSGSNGLPVAEFEQISGVKAVFNVDRKIVELVQEIQ